MLSFLVESIGFVRYSSPKLCKPKPLKVVNVCRNATAHARIIWWPSSIKSTFGQSSCNSESAKADNIIEVLDTVFKRGKPL